MIGLPVHSVLDRTNRTWSDVWSKVDWGQWEVMVTAMADQPDPPTSQNSQSTSTRARLEHIDTTQTRAPTNGHCMRSGGRQWLPKGRRSLQIAARPAAPAHSINSWASTGITTGRCSGRLAASGAIKVFIVHIFRAPTYQSTCATSNHIARSVILIESIGALARSLFLGSVVFRSISLGCASSNLGGPTFWEGPGEDGWKSCIIKPF